MQRRREGVRRRGGVACLGLRIGRLRRELYGRRSERKERLLDRLELQLHELEAERTAAGSTEVIGFTRLRLRPRGTRAAAKYALIGTARLNVVDPQAWLADVLGRIAETPRSRHDELLPWNWDPAPHAVGRHRLPMGQGARGGLSTTSEPSKGNMDTGLSRREG